MFPFRNHNQQLCSRSLTPIHNNQSTQKLDKSSYGEAPSFSLLIDLPNFWPSNLEICAAIALHFLFLSYSSTSGFFSSCFSFQVTFFCLMSTLFLENSERGAKKQYKPFSRNLLSVESKRSLPLIQIGRTNIINFLQKLPATKHSLPDLRVDSLAFAQLGCLLVVMHGFVMDTTTKQQLSFDRSFLLLPPPEGSMYVINTLASTTAIVNNSFSFQIYFSKIAPKQVDGLV